MARVRATEEVRVEVSFADDGQEEVTRSPVLGITERRADVGDVAGARMGAAGRVRMDETLRIQTASEETAERPIEARCIEREGGGRRAAVVIGFVMRDDRAALGPKQHPAGFG